MMGKKSSALALLAAVLMWSSSFPLLKLCIGYLPPITLAAIRYLVAASFMFLIVVTIRGKKETIQKFSDNWKKLTLLGFIGIALPNAALNLGLQYTTASLSSIIQASGPAFTIVLAVLILGDKLTPRKVAGLILALIGTILLVRGEDNGLEHGAMIGNLLVLTSAVSYSFSGVLAKKELATNEPAIVNCWSLITGSLILSLAIPLEENNGVAIPPDIVLIILFLALFPGCIAFLLYYQVLKEQSLSSISYFLYLIPLFSTMISIPMLGETVTLKTALFAILIIAGVAISQYNPLGDGEKKNDVGKARNSR
ncbi:MAG: DMT family transporter [Methanomassiliicoccales archaeon]|jgi:drug/metabolite transporter (DMT)-like permease|nr:DMT family transporter [Methanomassiliicoccales archaeon]